MRVLVLHSAYGLRPAIFDAGLRLAAAGHRVRSPDLYDGETADTLEAALAIRDRIGRDILHARAVEAVESWKPDAIIGFSLGASIAQRIAMRTGSPKTLVLFHGAADVESSEHLRGLRVQAHIARGDAFAPEDELATWTRALTDAGAHVELHRSSGGHLFTDPGLPDFDASARDRAWELATAFLGPAR